MEKLDLITFCLLFLFSFTSEAYACDDDWEPYESEKCLKVFDTAGLVSYEEAESFCRDEYDANLTSIGSEDKQTFLQNFLMSKEIVDYVWIGLKYESDNNYVWSDNSDFVYSNWASGSPKNDPEYCVQIETEDATFGKWVDVPCVKKNVVLCEKVQLWSLSQLQDEVMNIKKNMVPIGFIYVQLPKEKPPAEIWSWVTWEDVTSDYAGVFFRAEGANSSSFGSVQEEDSPRLIATVEYYADTASIGTFNIPADGESHVAFGAQRNVNHTSNYDILNVTVSDAEVRPRNMAIRIWKRTQ